uniref:Apolipoprotein D-like n=1 Tax=Crassostrea virginica TaxID=6565 RepID=A0A8B8CBD9_CRAVI|nr:apolipoprotein D-like [Crassostrea virginica]
MLTRIAVLICLCAVNISTAFILDTFLGSAVQPVPALDVQKYLGRWFQMYGSQSIYATFERGAYCVTADYTLANDGTNHITVLNSERLNSATGPIKVIHGYATPSDTPGKLTVHLETVIFDAPYWVIKLGPATYGSENQYQYAIVSDNLKATLSY